MKTATPKGKFSSKGKKILGTQPPTGIGDFLETEEIISSSRTPVFTENRETAEIRNNGNTEIRKAMQEIEIPRSQAPVEKERKIREEFQLDESLAERLRRYAFDRKMKKVAVVSQALEQFLKQEGY